MNIRDLYTLNESVIQIIEKNNPGPSYQELSSHLDTMRTNPTREQQAVIKKDIVKIKKQNANIEKELQSIPHIDYLETNTKLYSLVGTKASDKLVKTLNDDPYLTRNNIAQASSDIADYLVFLRDTNKSLSQYGVEAPAEEVAFVSFELAGEAGIDNTAELIYRLGEIQDIVHAFSRLAGDPNAFRRPKIYSISKSSPIIIDLGGLVSELNGPITLIMIGNAITWCMSRIEQVQNIKLQYQQLKKNKMLNDKIEEGLNQLESDTLSKEEIQSFVDSELINKTSNISDGAGSPEEIRKALAEAIKNILKLIQKGASANVYMPDSIKDSEEISAEIAEELSTKSQQITALRKSIEKKGVEIKKIEAGDINSDTGD